VIGAGDIIERRFGSATTDGSALKRRGRGSSAMMLLHAIACLCGITYIVVSKDRASAILNISSILPRAEVLAESYAESVSRFSLDLLRTPARPAGSFCWRSCGEAIAIDTAIEPLGR